MRVLFIGDITGRAGRRAVAWWVPRLQRDRSTDFIIANAENAAGGHGITAKVIDDLFDLGVNAVTTGNHAWDKPEGHALIEEGRVLRPANYPPDVNGIGSTVIETHSGETLGVINLQGRIFMPPIDCPFRTARREIERLRSETNSIIVDFHAEATAEKQAMGWYLDGQVSAVIGTHTHVPTADERVLPNGTAYISDVGMTGAYDSVIGMETRSSIQRLLTGLNTRMEPARADARLGAVIIDVDTASGKAERIERLLLPVGDD